MSDSGIPSSKPSEVAAPPQKPTGAKAPPRKSAPLRLVGVRTPDSCMIYRLVSSIPTIRADDQVLLHSKDGEVVGRVVFVSSEQMETVPTERLHTGRFTRIIRIANDKDLEFFNTREEKERQAKLFCRQKIREMKLPMKLSRVNCLPGGKGVFHFTAETRVDFRDLVKVLGSHLKMRVEMHHVGVRDETRLLGGVGPCGKTFCCSQYLKRFHPVSVRMAKNQGLSLNPEGISGVCGRLLCCLAYENNVYQEILTRLPKPKSRLWTQDGREGTAKTIHILAERVEMQFGDGTREQFSACDLCRSKPEGLPAAPVDAVQTAEEVPLAVAIELDIPDKPVADRSQGAEPEGRERSRRRGGRKRSRGARPSAESGAGTAPAAAAPGAAAELPAAKPAGEGRRGRPQAGGTRDDGRRAADAQPGEPVAGAAPGDPPRRRRRRRGRKRGGAPSGGAEGGGGSAGPPPAPAA